MTKGALQTNRKSGKRGGPSRNALVRGNTPRGHSMGGKLSPPWSPRNRKIAARNGRLHRLMRKGIIKPMTKDEQRDLAQHAAPRTKPSA